MHSVLYCVYAYSSLELHRSGQADCPGGLFRRTGPGLGPSHLMAPRLSLLSVHLCARCTHAARALHSFSDSSAATVAVPQSTAPRARAASASCDSTAASRRIPQAEILVARMIVLANSCEYVQYRATLYKPCRSRCGAHRHTCVPCPTATPHVVRRITHYRFLSTTTVISTVSLHAVQRPPHDDRHVAA